MLFAQPLLYIAVSFQVLYLFQFELLRTTDHVFQAFLILYAEFGVEESFTLYQGLVLPFYPVDLTHVGQRLTEEQALKFGQEMRQTLA